LKIDNSAANAFRHCPDFYRERYINKLEKVYQSVTGADFGTRWHDLLAQHYAAKAAGQPLPEPEEAEAQEMLAAYKAQYPEEPFEVVAWEQTFQVPVGGEVECACGYYVALGQPMLQATPGGLRSVRPTEKKYKEDCTECKGKGKHAKHLYTGRWDGVVRMKDSGKLKIFETKTEKRNGKANSPTAWATRDQGSLYLYSGAYVFGESFDGVILNVCTRGSEKGLKPAGYRRDKLERTKEQILLAVRDIVQTADDIEAAQARYASGEPWLQHRENCTNKLTDWACDYEAIHTYGRTEQLIQVNYKKAEDYLETKNPGVKTNME